MRLPTKQTDQFTESAYGRLLDRQKQLHDETLAIISRKHASREFWKAAEEIAAVVVLVLMFSMGAWLGPVSNWVLSLLGN